MKHLIVTLFVIAACGSTAFAVTYQVGPTRTLKKLQDVAPSLQPGDVPQTFADVTKARRLLAYNPQTQIEDGINKFVEWLRRSSAS